MDLGLDGEGGSRRGRSNQRGAAAVAESLSEEDDSPSDEDDGDESSDEYQGSDESSASGDESSFGEGSDEEGSDLSGSTGAAAAAAVAGGGSRLPRGSRASSPADSAAAAGVKAEVKPEVKSEVKAEAGGARRGRGAASRGSSMNLRIEDEDLEVIGRNKRDVVARDEHEKVCACSMGGTGSWQLTGLSVMPQLQP